MTRDPAAGLDFTNGAEEVFYDVVDDPRFRSQDQALIFAALQDALKPISFGEHLKRYIYQKTEMTDNPADVPLSLYQEIVVDAFRDTRTPVSFSPGKTTLRAAVKNWLSQQAVSRETVLILGFGLSMTSEEVNMFLTKVLREHRLSPKEPLEVVCDYCYRHHLSFLKCGELLDASRSPSVSSAVSGESLDSTIRLETEVSGLSSEEALIRYIGVLRDHPEAASHGATARAWFDRLYAEAREVTAGLLNAMETDDAAVRKERLSDALSRDDRRYDFQKREILNQLNDRKKSFRAEEIGPADLEKVLCSAIPATENGNYLSARKSMLCQQFEGKRFSRKHMSGILQGKEQVTRFDLITLCFYNTALRVNPEEKELNRYRRFVDGANAVLTDSSMGTLYIANPYDCFVIMCMLTEDPLGTYADVWELSYQNEQKDG